MDDITAYVRSQPLKKFPKDSILTYQGELPRTLYAIRSGYVKIYDLSSDGNEQFLGLAGKHDFIPLDILFDNMRAAQFFYGAFTPVEAYAVNCKDFMDRVRGDAVTLYMIAKMVTEKYHGQLRHLTAAQKPKAREKIVYVLHFLSVQLLASPIFQGKPIPLPLTQQDIANLVGVTRETAAHELKHLKNEGYISYSKNTFYIHAKLEHLVA